MPKLIGRAQNASSVGNGGDDRIPVAKNSVYYFIQPRAITALMRIDKNSKFVGIEKSCLRLWLRAAAPGGGGYFEGAFVVKSRWACVRNGLYASAI